MEEYNKSSSGGQFRLNTLEKAFSCWGGDSLEVENGDQHATTLATMGTMQIADMEKKKMYGDFMATNSKEFANYFTSFGQLDAVKGHYLNWYYLEEPASIKGECAIETYTRNQKESYKEVKAYDFNFKKQWNIVKAAWKKPIRIWMEKHTPQSGLTAPLSRCLKKRNLFHGLKIIESNINYLKILSQVLIIKYAVLQKMHLEQDLQD